MPSTPNGTLPPPTPYSAFSPKQNDDDQGNDPLTVKFGTTDALSHVPSLTDVGSMTRLLQECIAYQRSLDDSLDALLSQRVDLDRHLADLQHSAEVLHIVKTESDQVLSNVTCTCEIADRVSAKVRELDLAQSRVSSTLLRIDATVEKSNCLNGARAALASFLEIDERYKDSRSEQRDQMLGFKAQLEGIVKRKMAAAVDQRDHPTIPRFVKLYSPLGMEVDSLNVYVGYWKKVVSMRSRLEFEHMVELMENGGGDRGGDGGRKVNFVAFLTNLFEDIVLAVEQNDGILRELCGEDGIVYAILQLEEECDSRASLIMKKYMEYRKLGKVSSEINAQNKNLLAVGDAIEGPDPRCNWARIIPSL